MTAALLAAALAALCWPDPRSGRGTRLRGLDVSGSPARRPVLVALPVAGTAAVAAAAATALVSPPLVAALAALTAYAGGRTWNGQRLARRSEQRLRSVAESLGALGAELRSGRSFEDATAAAVASCPDETCRSALTRALRAPGAGVPPGLGADLTAALGRVSAGVLVSARTGCSLAAVTAAVEDDLRSRHRLGLELRTATAGPRASAMLLAALPLLGLAMGGGVGADPWRVLTTTGTGQVLLVVGVALELIGLSWSERLVRRAVR
ncbi:type II secretion system F family protein [Blastococcus haudaquaticus]|uniref:Tight adherence protein B n=1 Tax=Blastococcus haudaquaticus TaxID=1938745 RepID=A0A286GYU1_9ACTN|nr:pilus assembly protein TadB [Blastococcus haudaquaticus]SOE00698.1 tight adherence protein B [Blastococcus haudaquaticus]